MPAMRVTMIIMLLITAIPDCVGLRQLNLTTLRMGGHGRTRASVGPRVYKFTIYTPLVGRAFQDAGGGSATTRLRRQSQTRYCNSYR